MFDILQKQELACNIKRIVVNAPHIAKKAEPGQFIILRVRETGERIPLTISDSSPESGTITLIFQEVGKSTFDLGTLEIGSSLHDMVGPLGKPTDIEKVGTVVVIGGGVGTAVMYPVARAFKQAGNFMIGILGARSADMLILEDEFRAVSDNFHITTDDGSKGRKGFVSDALTDVIEESGREVNLVCAIGPLPMMRAVCNVTEKHSIKTIVSLNPIMVDGTGMCGACRVSIKGETKFACVDGPEFDGHSVDWELLKARQSCFWDPEKASMTKFEAECKLKGGA